MTRIKKIFLLAFSLLFIGILLGAVCFLLYNYRKWQLLMPSTPPDRNIETIRKDFRKFKSFSRFEFSELVPLQLRSEDEPLIAEYELDRKELGELRLPAYWNLNIAALRSRTFPIRVGMKNKVLSFSGPIRRGYYEIRTEPFLNYGAADYLMTVSVSGKGKLRMGSYGYGQEYTGDFREIICNYKEPVSFLKSVTVAEKPGIQTFSFALSFVGELKVSDLQVYVVPRTRPECSFAEGELLEVSPLPPPEKSDYPNCHFTAKLRVNGIFSGEPLQKQIQLVVPGFQNKKLLPAASLKKGDRVRVSVVPFEKAAQEEKSVQQADALEDFNLHSYFAFSMSRIPEFQKVYPGIPVLDDAGESEALGKPVNPPLSKESLDAKRRFVRTELERMNRMIREAESRRSSVNKEFSEVWARRAARYNVLNPEAPPEKQLIWANDGGHFFTLPRHFELVGKPVSMQPQNLQAIRVMKDFFEENGVRFLIQIIPDYYDIAARALNPEFADFPDVSAARVARELLENGVETLYSSDRMVRMSHDHPLLFFYPKNAHPATGAQEVLTDQMCGFIRDFPMVLNPLSKGDVFSMKEESCKNWGNEAWPEKVDTGRNKGGEIYSGSFVYLNGRRILFDPNSPLLVFGNSYIQTPMNEGAYASYLARKLHHVPDHIRVSGMGPFLTIPKMFFANRQKYLAGKKLAVLPVGLNHLLLKNNFLNLQDLAELHTKLNGKPLSRTIHPAGKPASPDIMRKAAASLEDPEVKIAAWDDFITQNNGMSCLVAPGKEQVLYDDPRLARSAENRNKPFAVLVKIAAFYEKNITLSVNGVRKFVPAVMEVPRWNFMVFELPPGTESLHIALTGSDPDAVAAVQSISIHGL